MAKLSIEQTLTRAKSHSKKGEITQAQELYVSVLRNFPNNKKAQQGLAGLSGGQRSAAEQGPPQAVIDQLMGLYRQGQLELVVDQTQDLTVQFPKAITLWNMLGASAAQLGKLDQAVKAFEEIISLNPNQASSYYNLGNALKDQGKVEEAIEAYNKALVIKPDYEAALNNVVIALKTQDESDEKRIKKALETYNKAQTLKADNANSYFSRALDLQAKSKLDEAIEAYTKALAIKPDYADAYYNMGNVFKDQSKFDEAIEAYTKALAIKPDYAEGHNNMGVTFKDQGKLEEAIEAYTKAHASKPDDAEAYSNMGVALADHGKLEEAIEACNKALAIKPDHAEAYLNMGVAFKDQGRLEEAIEAYSKALATKPDYAEAYSNMGVSLADQGKLEEAIDAYNKALAIKPDYAGTHRNLSIVTKYNSDTAQISEVEALLQRTDLDDSNRCHLLYTHAKMQEDLGDLSAAFDSYVTGGDLRQKLLGYEFAQDEHLFDQIKRTAPKFKNAALKVTDEPIRHTPIFILGMPRSGTTLVEQIISSHSEVTGAGELHYTQQFGFDLTVGQKPVNSETVQSFRKRYLAELAKRADGQAFITDKMPQNFRYIALICAALPEAKIVHVQRSAEATCWSNFKHYFASKGLGYSYDLRDTVKYYGLYKDLMHFWSQSYSDRIYNLDYDTLTEDQDSQTRRLIDHLELNWEDACLAPQNNTRSVKTASQQQVRRKVYTGSSHAWRKYEPFLDDIFDGLKA